MAPPDSRHCTMNGEPASHVPVKPYENTLAEVIAAGVPSVTTGATVSLVATPLEVATRPSTEVCVALIVIDPSGKPLKSRRSVWYMLAKGVPQMADVVLPDASSCTALPNSEQLPSTRTAVLLVLL